MSTKKAMIGPEVATLALAKAIVEGDVEAASAARAAAGGCF